MTMRSITEKRTRALLGCGLAALFLASCGGDDSDSTEGGASTDPQTEAANPVADNFPAADSKSLAQIAKEAKSGLTLAPGTQVYTPGENRLAFGLLDADNAIVYAPTAVYVGKSPSAPAQGPFVAPTDSLITEPAYRSRNAATEAGPFAAVYEAEVPLDEPGVWSALVLSNVNGRLIGATAQLKVTADSKIAEVGSQAPVTDTDTVAEAGDITKIDTRVPPDTMHETNFADVAGEKPVALHFATPALCQSRVCGPVTDIAEQLKSEYGDRVEFIHQEVYVDNDPAKGIRPPLADYGLRSEPWLFTIDADGKVAARLEGSFGTPAFEEAIQAALE